jgi:glycosyltransferase involved in cell wall biosynthesis
MSKKSPLFSVIIPTHRRARLLRRALGSVKAQNLDDLIEVVVVSDAIDLPTDLVCNSMLGSNDIYMRRSGVPGPSESRNLGLSVSSGQYILFLDDDDAWHPQFILNLGESIATRPLGPLYFNCSVAKESRGAEESEILSEVLLDQRDSLNQNVYIKNQIHMSCFVFPRVILDGLKFDPHMRAYEDWDFLLFAFDRAFPAHINILGSRIFEVDDATTDRRGSTEEANNFNAVLDYLYVYRRHPGSTDTIKQARHDLLSLVGLRINRDML